jgi:hypothetical protein
MCIKLFSRIHKAEACGAKICGFESFLMCNRCIDRGASAKEEEKIAAREIQLEKATTRRNSISEIEVLQIETLTEDVHQKRERHTHTHTAML